MIHHDAYWIGKKEQKKEAAKKKLKVCVISDAILTPIKDNRSYSADQLYSIMDSINL